jgi:exopolysaccharide biosynthesis protein
MNAWSSIQYVGTGLGLVAFVVAALLYAYRARLRQRAEIIKSAPATERLAAIESTAELFRVDLTGLSASQRQAIVLAQIEIRARRELLFAGLALVTAVLLAAVSIVTIVQNGSRVDPSQPRVADPSDQPASSSLAVNIGDFSVYPEDDSDLTWLKIKIERNFVDYLVEKGVRVGHRASTFSDQSRAAKQILGAVERGPDGIVEVRVRLVAHDTVLASSSHGAQFDLWRENYKSIPELMTFALGLVPETLEKRETLRLPTVHLKAALLYFEAVRVAKATELDRASALFDRAIAEDGSFALAYWGKSQILYAAGKVNEGEAFEKMAAKIDIDHAKPRIVGEAVNPLPSVMVQLQKTNWAQVENDMLFRETIIPSYKIDLKAWSFDPAVHRLDVVGSSSDTGSTVQDLRLATGSILAVNGGYFDIDRSSRLTPSGLLVSRGKMLSKATERRKGGSGVVYERAAKIAIDFIEQFSQTDEVTAAVQVGPLVVDPGGRNGIRRNDHDRQDRAAICQSRQGRIIIVVVVGGLSLFELGEVLSTSESAGGFNCDRALNLDGGPSTQVSFALAGRAADVVGRWKIANAILVSKR